MLTRRSFIKAAGMLMAAMGVTRPQAALAEEVTGTITGASFKLGHKLWAMAFQQPSETIETDTVIIGGGIAGLGAGYRLQKSGMANFKLLELEPEAGGNARSGKNGTSAYPWGAHYVPLLTDESRAVRKLFGELGIITGQDEQGRAIYNDYYLCSDPHERLYMYGRWQEGLLPQSGASDDDRRQYEKFFAYMESLKNLRGADGRRLFCIPVDESSRDPDWLKLDAISMKEWMDAEGYTSKFLQWHVDYSCRDDYGTVLGETSAWAGLHYFAARSGVAANTDTNNFVTWPEGNGFLAHALRKPIERNIVTQALAYKVRRTDDGVTVDYYDQATDLTKRIKAKSVIMATPQFITTRLMPDEVDANACSYAAWVVANITLDAMPEGAGAELAWDNMIYDSKLLGYVVATHQGLEAQPRGTVITYYWPLSHLPPKEARKEALARPYREWRDIFLAELLAVHPELKGHVKSLDLCIWAHAMIRPVKGYIWGSAREKLAKIAAPIYLAHSDLSGISIFEEAYTHGVRAAENVLTQLGVAHDSEL